MKEVCQGVRSPIQGLSDAVVANFVGDAPAEVARKVSREAKRVLEVSGRVLGPVKASFEVLEDPVEALRQSVIAELPIRALAS